MTGRAVFDASALPTLTFGQRNPLWWGQVLMFIIEGALFAILIASYAYVRVGFAKWPPTGSEPAPLLIPTLSLAVLLISMVPMHMTSKAAEEKNRRSVVLGFVLTFVCLAAFFVLRIQEFHQLTFKWNSGIYGSLVWFMIGLHTTHAIADTAQTAVMFAIVMLRRVGEKEQLGITIDGLYWYFVVLSWIPLYFLIYLYPLIARS